MKNKIIKKIIKKSLLDIDNPTYDWEQANWTCPHCEHATTIMQNSNNYIRSYTNSYTFQSNEYKIDTEIIICPNENCEKQSILIVLNKKIYTRNVIDGDYRDYENNNIYYRLIKSWHVEPQGIYKDFSKYKNIPESVCNDYKEACLIKELSPNASAAISRRCLQTIIRDYWGIKKNTLNEEIQELSKINNEEKGHVNPMVIKAIDKIRKLGNIGCHFEKQENSLPSDVTLHEADQIIHLIEYLIKEWYIQYYDSCKMLKNIGKTREPSNPQKDLNKKEPSDDSVTVY